MLKFVALYVDINCINTNYKAYNRINMSNKLDRQNPDFVDQNIEKLATLFPQYVTEVRFDNNDGITRSQPIILLKCNMKDVYCT